MVPSGRISGAVRMEAGRMAWSVEDAWRSAGDKNKEGRTRGGEEDAAATIEARVRL